MLLAVAALVVATSAAALSHAVALRSPCSRSDARHASSFGKLATWPAAALPKHVHEHGHARRSTVSRALSPGDKRAAGYQVRRDRAEVADRAREERRRRPHRRGRLRIELGHLLREGRHARPLLTDSGR